MKENSTAQEVKCACVIFLSVIGVIFVTCAVLIDDRRDPRVALETIALSLHLHPDYNMTKWDVTVSVGNRFKLSYLEFGEVSVWVSYKTEGTSPAVVVPGFKLKLSYLEFGEVSVWVSYKTEGTSPAVVVPGFKLGVGDAVLVNGTVIDRARDELVHGSAVDVFLRGECRRRYLPKRNVTVACRDIGVGVLSGATRGRKYCTVFREFDPLHSSICGPPLYTRDPRFQL